MSNRVTEAIERASEPAVWWDRDGNRWEDGVNADIGDLLDALVREREREAVDCELGRNEYWSRLVEQGAKLTFNMMRVSREPGVLGSLFTVWRTGEIQEHWGFGSEAEARAKFNSRVSMIKGLEVA